MFSIKKPKGDHLSMDYADVDGSVVVRLTGGLDSVSSKDFQTEAVVRCKGKDTTLDMDGVSYLSSAGLRAILALDKALGDKKLSIINAKNSVKDVLDMSGFSWTCPDSATSSEVALNFKYKSAIPESNPHLAQTGQSG